MNGFSVGSTRRRVEVGVGGVPPMRYEKAKIVPRVALGIQGCDHSFARSSGVPCPRCISASSTSSQAFAAFGLISACGKPRLGGYRNDACLHLAE
jgi:hypothetical protein